MADRQTAIGAFAVGGVILAAAAIIFFGHFHFVQRGNIAAIVFQNSISGLAVGAPVTFRGVRVGSVTNIAIEFDPKTHVAYIPVIVRLYRDNVRVTRADPTDHVLSNLIARGLHAELNMTSFVTGQSEIDLDMDPSAPKILHPDITDLPEIPTKVSPFERVSQQLSELPLNDLAKDSIATLRSVEKLSDRLGDDLPPLIASLKSTSDRSAEAVDAARGAITDLQGRLDITLGAITQLAKTGDSELNSRGADLHALLIQSAATVRQARGLVDNLRALTSENAGARLDAESTLRDLSSAAAALRGFASDVEHNPQLLLTGRRN
jgi:paraquat-inducible protein B